nr:VCBS repeat-containing protein [Pseudomonas sp. BIGb0427]
MGDFDNDGDADILYQTGGNGSLWAFARSNGNGSFTLQSLAQSPFAGLSLPDHTGSNYHVADFDGDGDLDVLAGVNSTTGTYLRNDGGSFSSQSTASFPAPAAGSRMLAADFDNDGDADLLYQTGANGTGFAYARSNGNGTFTLLTLAQSPFAGLTLPDHNGSNYYAADIDGDGDIDVLAGSNATTGVYLRNDGASFSNQSTASFPAPAAFGRMVLADFDSDGDADILYQTGGNGTAFCLCAQQRRRHLHPADPGPVAAGRPEPGRSYRHHLSRRRLRRRRRYRPVWWVQRHRRQPVCTERPPTDRGQLDAQRQRQQRRHQRQHRADLQRSGEQG